MLYEREQATHCEGCSTASTSTRPGCASALIWVCATRALYCLRMRSSQATQFENGAALSWIRAPSRTLRIFALSRGCKRCLKRGGQRFSRKGRAAGCARKPARLLLLLLHLRKFTLQSPYFGA